MELAIDSILQTLLVGAIVSLCIAVLIFLFLEHLVRIRVIGKIFKFVLYEAEPYPTAESHSGEGSMDRIFTSLLLVAALFGLGIAAESGSDYATDHFDSPRLFFPSVFSDPDIRADAFERIGATELRSGRPNDRLARLYTDHLVCEGLPRNNRPDDPCRVTRDRVNDLYYYAKNQVFAQKNYFDELTQIQSRIDFIRTLSHAFMVLAIELFIGFAVAALAEVVDALVPTRRDGSALPGWAVWWRQATRETGTLIHHLKNLSAYRLAVLCVISVAITWGTIATWRDVESRYDRRVFGYFFCCATGGPEATPDSGYRIFKNGGGAFEPSGITALGMGSKGGESFLVVNDKDPAHLELFEYMEPTEELTLRRSIPLEYDGVDGATVKLEAIDLPTRFILNSDRPVFLAGGVKVGEEAFEPTLFITTLTSSWTNKNDAADVPDLTKVADAAKVTDTAKAADPPPLRATRVDVSSSICKAAAAELSETDCAIEGMATRDGVEILVGVRSIKRVPVLALVKLTREPSGRYNVKLLSNDTAPRYKDAPVCSSKTPGGPALLGISDIKFDDSGNLLLLASFEEDGGCPDWEGKDPSRQVQGALWRIKRTPLESATPGTTTRELLEKSKDDLQSGTEPLRIFAHKPEGISFVGSDTGSVLVVFDDDARRKKISTAPATFAERQSESVFLRVRVP